VKVIVSYEFDSQEEAAKFLAGSKGGKSSKGGKGSKGKEDEAVTGPAAETASEPEKPALTDAAFKALLDEVVVIIKSFNTRPNAPENKAHILTLIQKNGGTDKVTTVPREKFADFVEAVKAFNDSLAESAEESLI